MKETHGLKSRLNTDDWHSSPERMSLRMLSRRTATEPSERFYEEKDKENNVPLQEEQETQENDPREIVRPLALSILLDAERNINVDDSFKRKCQELLKRSEVKSSKENENIEPKSEHKGKEGRC